MRAELGHESRGLVNVLVNVLVDARGRPGSRRRAMRKPQRGEMTAMNRTQDHSENRGGAPSRLESVLHDIAQACAGARRDPAEVTLVAVSKTFAAAALAPVLAAGQRVFGENRVQEAMAKWPALQTDYPRSALHLVGPLQSNKAKEAVALFDAIHSVDRPSLCAALAREIAQQGRRPRLMVQVNTGAEPQKAGVLPEAVDDFVRRCRSDYGLAIEGL